MIPPRWTLEKVKALEVFYMDRRKKFTKEEKIKIVKRYLAGEIGCTSLAREVGCNGNSILRWATGYKENGEDFFRDTTRHRTYTIEFKKQVIDYYFEYGSMDTTASKFCITTSVLRKWLKEYKSGIITEWNPMPEVYAMKGRRTTYEERKEIVHYCLAHDKNYKETAKVYSLPYSRVYAMVQAYIKNGDEGIMDAKTRKAQQPLTEIEKLQQENERLKLELELEKLKRELVQKKISLEEERLQDFKKKTRTKR